MKLIRYTRMDVNSLCLVTAPVLFRYFKLLFFLSLFRFVSFIYVSHLFIVRFRCPSTDIAGLVVNNQREKLFLHLVMESPAFI